MLYPVEDFDHILTHTEPLWQEFRGKRILLTGPHGWIGSWMMQLFGAAQLYFKIDLSVKPLFLYGDGFPVGDYDYVIHAAFAEDPDKQVLGTKQVLEFAQARGVKKLLMLSSGILNQNHTQDISRLTYKIIKEMEEDLALREWPFEVKIARMYTLTGPGLPLDGPYALSHFISDALGGSAIALRGFGDSIRSYLHLSDVMIWLLTILIQGKPRFPYSVGSDRPVTISSIADMVSREFNVPVFHQLGENIPFTYYLPDLSRTKELGLEIRVPLEQAIAKTCRWFKTNPGEGNRKHGVVRSQAKGAEPR